MRLTQTRAGKIIVQRKTRNGSYESMGTLNTKLSLKEAQAVYTPQIEEIEQHFNGRQDARQLIRDAIKGLNLSIEALMRKFRVCHLPQVGSSEATFYAEVNNINEARLVAKTLTDQHLFLFKNNFIPDFSNLIWVEEFVDGEWQEIDVEDDV